MSPGEQPRAFAAYKGQSPHWPQRQPRLLPARIQMTHPVYKLSLAQVRYRLVGRANHESQLLVVNQETWGLRLSESVWGLWG